MSFFEPVAATARRQHGLITRAQLNATGLTDRKVRTLVEHGTLVRKRRGLYVDCGASTATAATISTCSVCGGTEGHHRAAAATRRSSSRVVTARRSKGSPSPHRRAR